MRKTAEQLKQINTKNLLRYYKAERKRFYGAGYWCSCGCWDFIWHVRDSAAYMEPIYNEHKAYLDLIKTELSTREHVAPQEHGPVNKTNKLCHRQ